MSFFTSFQAVGGCFVALLTKKALSCCAPEYFLKGRGVPCAIAAPLICGVPCTIGTLPTTGWPPPPEGNDRSSRRARRRRSSSSISLPGTGCVCPLLRTVGASKGGKRTSGESLSCVCLSVVELGARPQCA